MGSTIQGQCQYFVVVDTIDAAGLCARFRFSNDVSFSAAANAVLCERLGPLVCQDVLATFEVTLTAAPNTETYTLIDFDIPPQQPTTAPLLPGDGGFASLDDFYEYRHGVDALAEPE